MGDRPEKEITTPETGDRSPTPKELEQRADQARTDRDYGGWFEAKVQLGEAVRQEVGDPLDRALPLEKMTLAQLTASELSLRIDFSGRLDPERRREIGERRAEIVEQIAHRIDGLRRGPAAHLAELSADERQVVARVAQAELTAATGADRASWQQLYDQVHDGREHQRMRRVVDPGSLRLHQDVERALDPRAHRPRFPRFPH